LDGFSNDDHPSEAKPGSGELHLAGEKVDLQKNRARWDLDYTGSVMPPPDAVAAGKVKPLSDEDRRTILRWIDLGCPLDRDYDAAKPTDRGRGWLLDDQRPTLTITTPAAGEIDRLDEISIGLDDAYTGIDRDTLRVTLDAAVGGIAAGQNLASKFSETSPGVLVWKIPAPAGLKNGQLTVSVRDKQGNEAKIVRRFSLVKKVAGK
jgi:hypothetical protein